MQKDNRGLTVAARRRQRETGETYMQALAAVRPLRLNRNPADATTAMQTMGFGQLMAAGAKALAFPSVYPGGAGAVVCEAVTALWPSLTPVAVADVLARCAETIASRDGYAEILDGWGNFPVAYPVAAQMLDAAAAGIADGRPAPGGGLLAPPGELASSLAADQTREDDVLTATWVLLALAHQRDPDDEYADEYAGDDEYGTCDECGGELWGKGTYGCACWNPSACNECGDEYRGDCGCRI